MSKVFDRNDGGVLLGGSPTLRGVSPAMLLLVSVTMLGACSALPEDGPSAEMVSHGATEPAPNRSYTLVDLNYRLTQLIAAHPAQPLAALTADDSNAPNDIIAVGDTLAVSIYQPGMVPLAPSLTATATPQAGVGPQSLPRSVVDDHGAILVPYAGPVVVAGHTPNQAADVIRRALLGRVANPQVIVTTISSPHNSVVVIGEVAKPGRYPLATNADHLLDELAIAGGPTKQARDLTVTVVRGDRSASIVLQTLLDDPSQNIRLGPQDQVRVTSTPRKIDVFGAVGKGAQIPLEDESVTLADALARIGGLNPNMANARSVFVFRFERAEVAKALGVSFPDISGLKSVPIVYRVNLRDPAGYFIAAKFQVAANDLIYVPTADVPELQKFLNVVATAAQFFYAAQVAQTL